METVAKEIFGFLGNGDRVGRDDGLKIKLGQLFCGIQREDGMDEDEVDITCPMFAGEIDGL